MSRSWRKLAGPVLLVLALVGTLVPALSVLAASEHCTGMQRDLEPEPADLPCQLVTPTSCCDGVASTTPPPAFAPPPAATWLTAAAAAPAGLRARALGETPRGDRLALATVVLRL